MAYFERCWDDGPDAEGGCFPQMRQEAEKGRRERERDNEQQDSEE